MTCKSLLLVARWSSFWRFKLTQVYISQIRSIISADDRQIWVRLFSAGNDSLYIVHTAVISPHTLFYLNSHFLNSLHWLISAKINTYNTSKRTGSIPQVKESSMALCHRFGIWGPRFPLRGPAKVWRNESYFKTKNVGIKIERQKQEQLLHNSLCN